VSPLWYELDFYILEDDIVHNYRRENLKSYNLQLVSPRPGHFLLFKVMFCHAVS
jgi:hypothetical protein